MIEVVVEDNDWSKTLPAANELADKCQRAAAKLETALNGEIALLLTGDAAIAELNQKFRSKSGPTNVLSFPSGDDGFIGDIALARETCEREAQEKNISLHDHAAHLIVHGMLHLIGYDHQNDDEAEIMENREIEILASLSIANPYLEIMEQSHG